MPVTGARTRAVSLVTKNGQGYAVVPAEKPG